MEPASQLSVDLYRGVAFAVVRELACQTSVAHHYRGRAFTVVEESASQPTVC